MKTYSSATATIPTVLPPALPGRAVTPGPGAGTFWGAIGVLAFSFTVPFTRIADEGLDPLFVGSGRGVVAAVLAIIALSVTRQRLPQGIQWARLAVIAAGIVAGFPLLTSFAMATTPASHGAVVIALLPAATATATIIRTREKPRALFWVMTAIGAVAALGFAFLHSGGLGQLQWSDLMLLGAVVAAGIGYAEGGLLARELGAWQTVSWALVIAAPLTVTLMVTSLLTTPPHANLSEWAAFAYLGVVSMFLGFFAWYHGLAIGPITQVSQIQLIQPVLTIIWAALLLGESLTVPTMIGGLVVILCAAAAVRVRATPTRDTPTQGADFSR